MSEEPTPPKGDDCAGGSAEQSPREFERLAERRQPSLAAEFLTFLRQHKKWWLAPLLLGLALYGLLIVIGNAGGPAFIYTLF